MGVSISKNNMKFRFSIFYASDYFGFQSKQIQSQRELFVI